jgi:hypothetical protein
MASRLTYFISSTVKDFGGVRRDLKEWLEFQGIIARLSDHDDFPVDPAVTSHDACLRAVADSHVLILLIGERYGGRYAGSRQSITWREYDEARDLGIPVIALVLRGVNEDAERWSRGKKKTEAKIAPPFGKDTEDLVAFIDAVRKGHEDNWMHLWDGSVSHAKQIIQTRCNALFVAYQRPHADLTKRAEQLIGYADARRRLDMAASAVHALPRRALDLPAACDFILGIVDAYREVLFGFREDDHHNLAIYWHRDGELASIARRAHPEIQRRDRSWPVGTGHVGLCFAEGKTLVSPDLRHTESWVPQHRSDGQNYVSAVAVPIISAATVRGVFVLTSNRRDQFRDLQQTEVLTAESLALLLGQIAGRR